MSKIYAVQGDSLPLVTLTITDLDDNLVSIAGAFIASANTGTSGVLYSAGDFSASRAVANGDTLNVTVTVSAS